MSRSSRKLPVCRLVVLILIATVLTSFAAARTKAKTAAQPDADYASALAVANHFLQAWQAGDIENGLVLLSSHAKGAATADAVEKFFSHGEGSAYEISHGKADRPHYEFSVVLITVSGAGKSVRARRRLSTIIVVDAGNNDWAVDKLP